MGRDRGRGEVVRRRGEEEHVEQSKAESQLAMRRAFGRGNKKRLGRPRKRADRRGNLKGKETVGLCQLKPAIDALSLCGKRGERPSARAVLKLRSLMLVEAQRGTSSSVPPLHPRPSSSTATTRCSHTLAAACMHAPCNDVSRLPIRYDRRRLLHNALLHIHSAASPEAHAAAKREE
eukprot:6206148-Pleurochrysis_carterae.AAC.1